MLKKCSLLLLLILPLVSFAQKHTISGYVEDLSSGERLIAAAVYIPEVPNLATLTNEYGYFSLTVPMSKVHLKVSYVGFESYEENFVLRGDTMIVVKLKPNNRLDEVVVTGQKKEVESTQMSQIKVPVEKVQSLPAIFGETDLLKTLQLMPGIQGGTEGTSGIYVRGGSPDQNLMLLDGVPIYNANHLFGFFSVFNTDAIKDVTVLKGGFPARYGGRLSSVVDVRMKDGNMQQMHGAVNIGVISSKLTLEGPIVKNKSSFLVSARRTYIDLMAKPVIWGIAKYNSMVYGGEDIQIDPGYYFYDLNGKINYKINRENRVFLSFYSGSDKAYIHSKYKDEYNTGYGTDLEQQIMDYVLQWGNTIAALRWNHVFNKKLFSNLTFTYSRFKFYTGLEYSSLWQSYEDGDSTIYKDVVNGGYDAGIDDFAAQYRFDYIPNANHYIRFGAEAIYHKFNPGQYRMFYQSEYNGLVLTNLDSVMGSKLIYSPEFAIYAEDDWRVTDWLKINVGGRLSTFSVRDTTFISPEPRISARVMLNKKFSIKASYVRMQQYLHFLTNNTAGLPTDLWLPATDLILPEKSWQAAAGIAWNFKEGFTMSLEGYYKHMDNLIEFKEGESIFTTVGEGAGEVWENKVTQGQGWSYGMEILLRKDAGKFTGWLGYTLAWAERQFPEISFGEVFPYKYDRRHSINLVLSYKLNDKVDFNASWIYMSGNPITLPQEQYMSNEISYDWYYDDYGNMQQTPNYVTYYYFGKRNNYRLPAYQRLDLGINFRKEKKHGTRIWNVGLYNAYNHINPFFTYLNTTYDNNREPVTKLRIFSIFPVMPMISYRFVW